VSAEQFQRVCAESELAQGQMRCVALGEAQILVCRTRDGLHAVDNICTHAYARLDEGRLRGHRLICPLHGASFDARTGAVLGAPATQPLRTYAVRVQDGQIEVQALTSAPG
jgi:nitrite reductase/ring-hydroxylating ferredoxin subunit